jgi:hypothetical protein
VASDVLISERGIGQIKLGASLQSATALNPNLDFARTSDGEGVALIAIGIGADTVIAYVGEDDPSASVDLTKPVMSLETMTPGFQTTQGIHAGSFVTDAESVYGMITRIDKSEIESREYVTFSNQPLNMTFRLESGTGVFEGDSMTTSRLAPRARIFSIAVQR